jgi:hypothetical protein
VLLLVNYRPEYTHGWYGKTYYRQLRIDPLPIESAADLLGAVLGDHTSLEPLRRLLIERTEGNPLFLEESVRTFVETVADDPVLLALGSRIRERAARIKIPRRLRASRGRSPGRSRGLLHHPR